MKYLILFAATALATSAPLSASPHDPVSAKSNVFPGIKRYSGIPAPDAPLSLALSEIRSNASANAPFAHAAIYAGLSKCRALRAYGPQEMALEYCSGVPETEIDDAGAWLSAAAERGDEGAMYVFSIAGDQELHTNVVAVRSAAAQEDYRVRSAMYLTRLSDRCNIDAMHAIYRQKMSGGAIFKKDVNDAYLLQLELLELYPGLIPPDERLVLVKKMSPAQMAQANAEARSFLDSQCR